VLVARSMSVRLQAQVADYVNGMRRAQQVTSDFRQELGEAAQEGSSDLTGVANSAIMMGGAITTAVAGVVMQGAKFEDAMAQVQAVSHATAEEFESMRRHAIEMGSSTVFSASQAAEATEELAKAGLSAAQITGGALQASLDLAAAGGLDLAHAATISAQAMNMFNLSAHEAGRIADALAAGSSRSATGVSALGQAMENVGGVASSVGFSVEETTGILAAFADNAMEGSEAGTNLRTTLLRLLAPTDQAKGLMDDLGISVFDAQGEAKGAVEIVRELENALSGMSEEQRTSTLNMLFGQRAIRGANILYQEGADSIEDYIEQVSEVGVAGDTAAARLDSLQGDVQLLRSALEGLAIDSSGAATGGLRMLTQTVTTLIGQINQMPEWLLTSSLALAGIVGVALLVGGTMLRLQARIAQVNTQLAAMGPAGAAAARGLGVVAGAANRVFLAFVALQVAEAIFSQFDRSAADVDLLRQSLEQLADGGEVSGEALRVFGDDLAGLRDALAVTGPDRNWLVGVGRELANIMPFLDRMQGWVTGGTFRQAAEDIDAFEQALLAMIAAGMGQEAFDAAATAAHEMGISYGDLEERMPAFVAAHREWVLAQREAEDQAIALTDSWQSAVETGQQLSDTFDELTGAARSSDRMQIRLRDTMDRVTEAIEENGRVVEEGAESFDLQDEKVRDSASALLDLADVIGDTVQAVYEDFLETTGDQAAALEATFPIYEEARQHFIDNAMEMGFTEEAAENLADRYLAMPETVTTEVEQPGMEKAQEEAELYADLLFLIGETDRLQTIMELPNVDDRIAALREYREQLRLINGTVVEATVRTINENIVRDFGPNAPQVERWGGVHTPAEEGLLRAGVYSTRNPARYAFAEPATGGEAFIPRRGDRDRSLSILAEAARWYGARVHTGDGDGAATAASVSTTYNVYPQRADITVHDLEALQRRQDALHRVGRPG